MWRGEGAEPQFGACGAGARAGQTSGVVVCCGAAQVSGGVVLWSGVDEA